MKVHSINFCGKPNNYAVIDNIVSRSAQPDADAFLWLSEHGVTDIINFRTMNKSLINFDEAELVKQLGMNYYHIPSNTRHPSEENIAEFLDIVSSVRANNGKVHIHCMAGADRTGMYSYIYKTLNGLGKNYFNVQEWIMMGHNIKLYPKLISQTKEIVKKLMN